MRWIIFFLLKVSFKTITSRQLCDPYIKFDNVILNKDIIYTISFDLYGFLYGTLWLDMSKYNVLFGRITNPELRRNFYGREYSNTQD